MNVYMIGATANTTNMQMCDESKAFLMTNAFCDLVQQRPNEPIRSFGPSEIHKHVMACYTDKIRDNVENIWSRTDLPWWQKLQINCFRWCWPCLKKCYGYKSDFGSFVAIQSNGSCATEVQNTMEETFQNWNLQFER